MRSDRDEMRAVLQALVVPLLRSRSFEGSFPRFLRLRADKVEFLAFIFWKYGGSFIVEIATADRQSFPTDLPPLEGEDRMGLWDFAIGDRARLNARVSQREVWFSFKNTWFRRGPSRFERPARQVAELLPQADAWWSGERVQPNVRNFSDQARPSG